MKRLTYCIGLMAGLVCTSVMAVQTVPPIISEHFTSNQYTAPLPHPDPITGLKGLPSTELEKISVEPDTFVTAMPLPTTHMSAGVVDNHAIHLTEMTQPIFIVGTDTVSKQWLNKNYKRLVALQAHGIIVNAASQTEVETLQKQLPALTLIPLSADFLQEKLSLTHYPVLITSTEISQ